MSLTNDLTNLASIANAAFTGLSANSSGLTSLTVAANTATFGTAAYLVANGNFGLGTSTPSAKLTVSGSVSAAGNFSALALKNTSDGGITLNFINSVTTDGNPLAAINANVTSTGSGTDDGILTFSTATNGVTAERMRIDSSGNIGIGTTSPSTYGKLVVFGGKIYVNGSAASNQAEIQIFNTDTSGGNWRIGDAIATSNGTLSFYSASASALRMAIDSSGNVGIGTNSPVNNLTINGSQTLLPSYATYLVNSYYSGSWKYAANGVAWGIGNNFSGVTNGVTIGVAAVNAGGAGAALTWNPAFNIDTSGRITTPYQPAFSAYGSGTQSFSGAQANTLVTLSNTNVNRGSYYNTTNGRFTAPVAGLYFFYLKFVVTTAGGASGPEAQFFVNNAAAGEAAINYTSTYYVTSSSQIILSLNANDYVTFIMVNNNGTSFTIDLGRCNFGGMLLG